MDFFSSIENRRLYSLIDLVRTNPIMYLGAKSITRFFDQLAGYTWACEDYNINDVSFLPLDIFLPWLAVKYQNKMSLNMAGILLMAYNNDEAKALDAFFVDWDEFLAQDHEMLKRDFLDEDGRIIQWPKKYWGSYQ